MEFHFQYEGYISSIDAFQIDMTEVKVSTKLTDFGHRCNCSNKKEWQPC